ncbi:hypothetical protein NKI36_25315 [Mesorhizobium caraganae]|uniref:Pilus assembly protein n=1 Tax=Mesorhizobium caraganae TaxID=483206 RepID=A0ABV1Z5Q8_9HYPH
MLKRVWDGTVSLWVTIAICSFLLFVTALGFMSARAYDRATQDYQTSRAYDETRRQFEQRCAGLEGKEIFDCLKEQIETAREPSRSEEDVRAQKEMARWALALLVVSGVLGVLTLIVTIVGVIFVRNTLEATRLGTKAAVDAAEAAIHNNTIIQAEQRPWVTLERQIPCEFRASGDTGMCKWKYGLLNRGKLPAQRVHVTQKLVRGGGFGNPLEKAFRAFVDEARSNALNRSGMVVFAGDALSHDTTSMTGGLFEQPGNEYALFVCVTYQHAGGVGIDANLLGISASQKPNALPPQYELLSFGRERVVE